MNPLLRTIPSNFAEQNNTENANHFERRNARHWQLAPNQGPKHLLLLFVIFLLFAFNTCPVCANADGNGNGNAPQHSNVHTATIAGHEQSTTNKVPASPSTAPQHTEGSSSNSNLFWQYLNRKMYGCATNYVSMLQKLNKLVLVIYTVWMQKRKQHHF